VSGGAGATTGRRRTIVLATRSVHKLRELRELLELEASELVSLDELDVDGDPVEDGLTFETNARIKARFAARATGLPALADDSGIEVDALGGGPGVRTRRYAGDDATDEQNNIKLLEALGDMLPGDRGARYVCALAFAEPSEAGGSLRIITARGTTRGRIAFAPRGSGGFGYDPIFEPQSEAPGGRTFGQWSASEKHHVSHRARAARRMRVKLAARGY